MASKLEEKLTYRLKKAIIFILKRFLYVDIKRSDWLNQLLERQTIAFWILFYESNLIYNPFSGKPEANSTNLEKELTFEQGQSLSVFANSFEQQFWPQNILCEFKYLFSINLMTKHKLDIKKNNPELTEIQGKTTLASRRGNQFLWVTWNWGVYVRMFAHALNVQTLFTLGRDLGT